MFLPTRDGAPRGGNSARGKEPLRSSLCALLPWHFQRGGTESGEGEVRSLSPGLRLFAFLPLGLLETETPIVEGMP